MVAQLDPVATAPRFCNWWQRLSHAKLHQYPDSGWLNYGTDPGGTQYSIAWQINRTNVNRLQLAWT